MAGGRPGREPGRPRRRSFPSRSGKVGSCERGRKEPGPPARRCPCRTADAPPFRSPRGAGASLGHGRRPRQGPGSGLGGSHPKPRWPSRPLAQGLGPACGAFSGGAREGPPESGGLRPAPRQRPESRPFLLGSRRLRLALSAACACPESLLRPRQLISGPVGPPQATGGRRWGGGWGV